MDEQAIAAVTQDSKNFAMLTWIGAAFFGFIPPLIFFLLKKDDEYAYDQAKESLNWNITALIAYLIGGILTIVLIGFLVMMAVLLVHIVFCIMGTVAASNGKPFRVPFALRLIK